jgi:diacylglycerol kinase family enzyme
MREALIIFNPAAGRFSSRPFIGGVINALERLGWRADAEATRSGAHTVELAKQAAGRYEAVFAIGGDGTIGQAASGLIGSETTLGVLPGGTQNVWGRELNLPVFSWWNWKALKENALLLADSPVYKIDMGLCNGLPFLMWAGLGLDAMAISAIGDRVRLEKFFAVPEYAAVTLWKVSQWNGLRLRVWADDEEVEGRYLLGVANNIRHYMGGLANLSPNAFVDDGLMDFWLFSGQNLGDALRHAYDLWQGRHLSSNGTRRIPFRTLRVEAEAPFMVQFDGDPAPTAQKVEIKVAPRALKVFIPPHALHLLQNRFPESK